MIRAVRYSGRDLFEATLNYGLVNSSRKSSSSSSSSSRRRRRRRGFAT
jgi:hypothetical protein